MSKIALITGATSGIGKASAEIFAKNGYDLIITGRRAGRLEELARRLEKEYKIRVCKLNFDIRKLEEVKKNISTLPAAFKNIDVLVNNAGLASGLSTIQDGDIEVWEKMIDTNIKGLLYITKEVANLMITRKQGHIINVGSVAGKEVYANGNVYCATKHAVDALNKAMRIDLLQHNIKVSAIHPGMVDTEFSLVRFHGDEDRAKKVYLGLKPLSGADIAESIYWMASRPAHVNINEIIIMPTALGIASTTVRK